MRRSVTWPQVGFLMGIVAAVMLFATSPMATTQSAGAGQTSVPAFMQANRCYRLTFSIAGSPNWKVLEVVDNGWVKAEIDAGPASTLREAVWINTAQVITARDAKCSA
jgi:hypothetical protein